MSETKRFMESNAGEGEQERPERSPEAVMEEISGEHHQALLKFCTRELRKLGDRNPEEVAADVVQETMLKAWKNVDKIDPAQSVRSWLFKIAQNTMIDTHRSERRRPILGADSLSDTGPDGDGQALEEKIGVPEFEGQLIAREEIERLLDLLDPENASIIRWKYVEGLDKAEIAENLSLGVDKVAAVIRRAEQQLKEKQAN